MMGSGGSGGVTDETCGTFVFEGESHTLGELRIQSGSVPVSSSSLFFTPCELVHIPPSHPQESLSRGSHLTYLSAVRLDGEKYLTNRVKKSFELFYANIALRSDPR